MPLVDGEDWHMCEDSLGYTANSNAASTNRKTLSLEKMLLKLFVGRLVRQIAQQLTVLAALAEDLNVVLSIHM